MENFYFIPILAIFIICEKFCKPVTKGYFFSNIDYFELQKSKQNYAIYILKIVFIVFLSLSFSISSNIAFISMFFALMSLILIIFLQNFNFDKKEN
ncbi:hypothetical protein [Arcobacter sp. FWKO B]|uniref:hypothetical protein n=1 Tax=Arcobacter sp. FWKO B TaxID=2593672 RepID=UPI0018A35CE9|nr:hypothetical protein [Arcobacter sp. FWKO B]QOG12048.1 hypothetical protein FWKOB_04710 [Arcobacter sp. FWKO B]